MEIGNMTVDEIRLRRDTRGMCSVALRVGDRWFDVIKDNGDVIDHYVTASGVETVGRLANEKEIVSAGVRPYPE